MFFVLEELVVGAKEKIWILTDGVERVVLGDSLTGGWG